MAHKQQQIHTTMGCFGSTLKTEISEDDTIINEFITQRIMDTLYPSLYPLYPSDSKAVDDALMNACKASGLFR